MSRSTSSDSSSPWTGSSSSSSNSSDSGFSLIASPARTRYAIRATYTAGVRRLARSAITNPRAGSVVAEAELAGDVRSMQQRCHPAPKWGDALVFAAEQFEHREHAAARHIVAIHPIALHEREPFLERRAVVAVDGMMGGQCVPGRRIARVGCERRAGAGRVGSCSCGFEEPEARPEGRERRKLRIPGGEPDDGGGGSRRIAGQELQAGECGEQYGLLGTIGQRGLDGPEGAAVIAGPRQCVRLYDRVPGVRCRLRADYVPLDHRADRGLGLDASELIDNLTAMDEQHGRDAADAKVRRHLLLLVDVELGEQEPPRIVLSDAIE